MKYLILPDVHLRWETAEKIIKHVKPDKTVFLGDYFDDFGDSPQTIGDTANWFRESVKDPNRIHICGNHDIHYWFKDFSEIRCSGYDQFKSIAINDIVKPEDWSKLQFYYVLDNKWLLSHAGVHPYWLNPNSFNVTKIGSSTLTKISSKLKRDSEACLKACGRKQSHWFYMYGFSRGYSPYYGGILWCDWTQEFIPIKGLHQIVGHTPCSKLSWLVIGKDSESYHRMGIENFFPQETLPESGSFNLCLDSQPGSAYYAIYENAMLTIHKTIDIK